MNERMNKFTINRSIFLLHQIGERLFIAILYELPPKRTVHQISNHSSSGQLLSLQLFSHMNKDTGRATMYGNSTFLGIKEKVKDRNGYTVIQSGMVDLYHIPF